jgi:hypothetical protein
MSKTNDVDRVPVHAIVSTPMQGTGAKWGMATVTAGEHAGKDVCIMVEYSDGWCICDMGGDDGMDTIRIEDMRLWVPVRAVVNRDGQTFYDPI